MKLTKLFAAFLILLTISLSTACSDDDSDGPNPNDVPLGTIQAKIGGDSFNSTFGVATITEVFGIQLFTISGVVASGATLGETLVLFFNLPVGEFVEATTYTYTGEDCDPLSEVCGSFGYGEVDGSDPDNETTFSSLEGGGNLTITITAIDYRSGGSVEGNFSGVGVKENGETVNITDGVFNVMIN